MKNIALGSASIIFPWDIFSFGKSVSSPDLDLDDWLNVEHSFDNYNTVIKSNDIKEKMRLFHISDSHLSILDNGKS